MTQSWLIRRGYGLFTAVGCLLLLGTAIGFVCSTVKWWGAERADGTVVKVEYRSSTDGGAYYPLVEFFVAGRRFECPGTFGFEPPVYKVGERVGVLYHPNRPDESIIDKFSQRWGGTAIFAAVGLLFVVVSRGMAAVTTQQHPAAPP